MKLWVQLQHKSAFQLGPGYQFSKYRVEGDKYNIQGFDIGCYEQPNGTWVAFDAKTGGRIHSGEIKTQVLGQTISDLYLYGDDFEKQRKDMPTLKSLSTMDADEAHRILGVAE